MSDPKTTELIVVRHGETVWNATGKQQGQLDSDLNELGIAQAQAAAAALVAERIDVMYSSDLSRAMQTAQIIAERLGLEILTDPRLRERHLGIIQGRTLAEFERDEPDEYARFRSGDVDYVIPTGESIRQRYERGVACADELAARHMGQRVLIVTHGGIVDGLFRHAVGLDPSAPRRFSLFNASINVFTVTDGQWKLSRWGDTHHLGDLDTKDDW